TAAAFSIGRDLRGRVSSVIDDLQRALSVCAVRAAVHRAMCLDAVPDDLALTVLADWGHFVNRTFETIEGVRVTCGNDLECHLVAVSADVADRHGILQKKERSRWERARGRGENVSNDRASLFASPLTVN